MLRTEVNSNVIKDSKDLDRMMMWCMSRVWPIACFFCSRQQCLACERVGTRSLLESCVSGKGLRLRLVVVVVWAKSPVGGCFVGLCLGYSRAGRSVPWQELQEGHMSRIQPYLCSVIAVV